MRGWKPPCTSALQTHWDVITYRALEGVPPGSAVYYGTASPLVRRGVVVERSQSSVLI